MNGNSKYALDFVIPVGPTGPIGVIGPTGPINNLNPIIFITYGDTTTYNVSLPILNITSLHDNESVFTENTNLIYINKPGYYKFTVSGILKENSDYNSSLILRARIQSGTQFKDLVTVKLSQREFTRYFSYDCLAYFNVPQAILVILNKIVASGASLENVSLIIQKISL